MEKNYFDSIALYCSSSENDELQFCYMTKELIQDIKLKFGQYCKICFDKNTTFICQIMPTVGNSKTVIFNPDVILGEITNFTKGYNKKISSLNIIPLDQIFIEEITVEVIVKSVDDVLKYRSNKFAFELVIRELLMFYGLSNNYCIKCNNHLLASLNGIVSLTVKEKCSKENEVCLINESTLIIIKSVMSEKSILKKVKCDYALGGLDHIVQDVCHIIKRPQEIINNVTTCDFVHGEFL